MLAVVLPVLIVPSLRAQDDDYLKAYSVVEQADALNTSGKTDQAHAKYVAAKQVLEEFKKKYPAWFSISSGGSTV